MGRSLEAALGALGPEDNAAKEQIQEAPRRAKEGRPDTVKAEAVAKVERLQRLNVGRPLEDGGRRSGPPICPVFLREPVDVFVGK